jgi:hypothetical protein
MERSFSEDDSRLAGEKFPAIYGTGSFITLLKRTYQ